MKTIKGYKTELDPNNRQRTALIKHAGAARWAFNWGLWRKQDHYERTGKYLNAIDLHRELNAWKKDELPWMYEVSKAAPQEALRDVDTAFKNFFESRNGKRQGEKVGFPHFKSKKKGLGGFRLTGSIKVLARSVQLPRLGKLRLFEKGYIPTDAKILSATVSEKAGRWFVSIQVQQEQPEPEQPTSETIGVDLGIKTLATCSDGEAFANPKALKAKTKLLVRWQRRLSRREKGSQNRKKAQRMVAKVHGKVANIRKDTLNKVTSAIVAKRPNMIVIEDLNVKGMLKNHKLARAIADVGFGEFKRQIMYKAADRRIEVVKANRFFPSSKTCSCCGFVKPELRLDERTFVCESCGFELDRDLNAAINLKNYVPRVSRELTPMESTSDLGCQAALAEVGTLSHLSIVETFV